MATSRLLFEDTEKQIVKKDLFSEKAEDLVKKFTIRDKEKDKRGKEKLLSNDVSQTQLRKFYNDVLSLKIRSENEDSANFAHLLPYIKMLKAKAVYARGREKVNNAFVKFIEEYVNSIKDKDDFKVFCDFFEAIVAYAPLYLKK